MVTVMSNFDRIDRDCNRFFGGGLLRCLEKIGDFAMDTRDSGVTKRGPELYLG